MAAAGIDGTAHLPSPSVAPVTSESSSAASDATDRLLASWGALHAFALPLELASRLRVRASPPATATPIPSTSEALKRPNPDEREAVGGLTCQVCGARFESLEVQRDHFRCDWHRFNVSRKQDRRSGEGGGGRARSVVNEEEFARMVESLEVEDEGQEVSGNSSSESDSSDDSNEEANGGIVARLLRRHRRLSPALGALSSEDEGSSSASGLRIDGSPLAWMTATPLLPGTTQFGVYRCALPNNGKRKRYLEAKEGDALEAEELRMLQYGAEAPAGPKREIAPPAEGANGIAETEAGQGNGETPPHWTVLMLGGGHFAAAVVSLKPRLRHVGKHRSAEKDLIVLAHKTFHRYTTRRKQGGGQSAHDSGGKGAAKSAGANLRRYNEQALAEDIRGLLSSWAPLLETSALVFLRASRAYSKLFFHPSPSDSPPILDRHDQRLRTFPFPTRRATLDEALRCVREVLTVKVVKLTEEELAELEAPPKPETIEAPKRKEFKTVEERVLPTKPKLSKEEERRLDRWSRVIDMIQKGRVQALDAFLARRREEDADADAATDEWLKGRVPPGAVDGIPGAGVGWTLLHVAAASDQPAIVERLLHEWHCDPTSSTATLQGESEASARLGGKTAYELAPSKPTRNVFRRAMAADPERCDWVGAARVPSALTEEMETAQAGRGKDRKARLKDKLKERDREREEAAAKAKAEEEAAATKAIEETKRKPHGAGGAVRTGPQKLGGGAAGILRDRQKAEAAGLSDEQRMRLERERRARAAEARLGGAKKA